MEFTSGMGNGGHTGPRCDSMGGKVRRLAVGAALSSSGGSETVSWLGREPTLRGGSDGECRDGGVVVLLELSAGTETGVGDTVRSK